MTFHLSKRWIFIITACLRKKNSFIGREKEIIEIKQALLEHRLVTLTGSGGTGKIRLSLQVAADLLDQFPDGVWFIELAPLTNPDLIPQTILSVLGVGEQETEGKTATLLIDHLRNKKLLLVLDNCEHLIEASAQLVDTLLSYVPELKIMASSREALGIKGEMAWHVPSLALPNIKNLPDIESLSHCEAVHLFMECATLAQPHFQLTKDNASFIAQICSRLEGIPLAIELAAAHVKALSVDQIAARLNDRFRLLTGGARTALPRQQTLRALIEYDIIAPLVSRTVVAHAGGVRQIAEARVKTDKEDVKRLIRLLIAEIVPEVWVQPVEVRELRGLISYRNRLVKTGTTPALAVWCKCDTEPTAKPDPPSSSPSAEGEVER